MLADTVEAEVEADDLWWIGAAIYLTGSVLINLGSNLIRSSHERLRKTEEPIPIYKRYLWMIGWSLFAIGNVLNFVAFMFAAQSLLVGLGSVQFVTNLAFARLVNKETITAQAIVATVIIVIGNIIIVIFGSKESQVFDVDELWELVQQPPFILYFSFCVVAVVVCQVLYICCVFYSKKCEEKAKKMPTLLSRFIPFSYAVVSALIGTYSVTIGKALSGIVLAAVDPDLQGEILTIWPWIILLLFIGFTIFWLYRMNVALKRYDAMFIIPVLQGMWLLFGTLCGGIYYEEFAQMSRLQQGMFAVGVVILLLGVVIMSPKTVSGDIEEAEQEDSAVVVVYETLHSASESDDEHPLLV